MLLRYVYICRYTPILYNHTIGCHGNHEILHNQTYFYSRTYIFLHSSCLIEQIDMHKKLSYYNYCLVQLFNGFLSQVSLIFKNMQMIYSFHIGPLDERTGQIVSLVI